MRTIFAASAVVVLLLTAGCASNPIYGQLRVTNVNVHCRIQPERVHGRAAGTYLLASYLGYVQDDEKHVMIPLNTDVRVQYWDDGFMLVAPTLGKEIRFHYSEGHMGMPVANYVRLITSTGAVDLSNFSEVDRKGIADGKIYTGMSRNAVRIAWGEPPRHATPFLERTRWVYWRNRFKKTVVEFDPHGRVAGVR